jgi:hypothetical protein
VYDLNGRLVELLVAINGLLGFIQLCGTRLTCLQDFYLAEVDGRGADVQPETDSDQVREKTRQTLDRIHRTQRSECFLWL